MKFLILAIVAFLCLVSATPSEAANETTEALVKEFLAKVNLTISPSGEGYKWMDLCHVKAEAENGMEANENTQACTFTAHGEIQQVKVTENGANSRCSYSDELYDSGTMLTYENEITNQYDAAIKLAAEAKYPAAVTLLQSMKTKHVQNLKVAANKDTARLTAIAKSAAWWAGGGNCNLILQGYVNILFN